MVLSEGSYMDLSVWNSINLQVSIFAGEYGLLGMLWSRWWLEAFITSASCNWSPVVTIAGAGSEITLPPATKAHWFTMVLWARCQVPDARCNFMAFGLYLTPFHAHPVIIGSGRGHRGGFALRSSGRRHCVHGDRSWCAVKIKDLVCQRIAVHCAWEIREKL